MQGGVKVHILVSLGPLIQRRTALRVALSVILVALAILLLPAAAAAQTATTTVGVGTGPEAVAINPITNKIYVANYGSNNVSVIDGATNTTTKVGAGTEPDAIAVNPLTNTIYVANFGSASVTVINGATNKTSTVTAGTNPIAIAVNPDTNTIYVANAGSSNVTVINGSTNATSTVQAGTNPYAVAVNPVTNMIYVANYNSANVTVIDGATNATTPVAAGTTPFAVAVNPVTNKIYVANEGSANVTIIDGATNTPSTVPAGTSPYAIAVNQVTNQAYVVNYGNAGSTSTVTVINGTSTSTSTIVVGIQPQAIAVNPITNQIYVANWGGGEASTVTAIDGPSASTVTLTAGSAPYAIAVNPATNRIYAANEGSNNVTVIDGATYAYTMLASGNYQYIAVAVNPVTDNVYVAYPNSNTVTVIDGATNATATVPVGSSPNAIAVDPVANKIYVANCGAGGLCGGTGNGGVTIIDGATNNPTTLAVGMNPDAVAVNPATSTIYFANYNGNNVTVMDGATNATSMVAVGTNPNFVVVNSATNKIYVSNNGSVTVIDGATLATTTVTGVSGALAVNPVTNKIFIETSGSVTMMDGVTNAITTVPAATGDCFENTDCFALNPLTNKVYAGWASGYYEGGVSVIDGATLAVTSVTLPQAAETIAVNPATNKVYVGNYTGWKGVAVSVVDGATNAVTTAGPATAEYVGNQVNVAVNPVTDNVYEISDSVTSSVIAEAPAAQQAANVAIQPFDGNTSGALPTFQMQAQDVNSNPLQAAALYWQMDTMQGQWLTATAASGIGNYTASPAAPLLAGAHVLYAYAVQGDIGDPGLDLGTPRIGSIAAYPFTVTAYTQVWLTVNLNTQTYGQPVTLTANVIPHPGGGESPTGMVTFYDGINFLGTATVSNGAATLTISSLVAGQHNISASYSGDAANAFSSGTLYVPLAITPATLTVTANSLSSVYGSNLPPLTYTLTGFVNGDTQASATTGTPTLSTTATGNAAVGSYPITITQSSLAAANYTFNLVNGTLTVTKAPLTVTAQNASRAYGSPNPAFAYTLSGFAYSDTAATAVTGTPALATTATSKSAAGSYPITAAIGSLAAANYAFTSFVPAKLNIAKAALTVTATNAKVDYNEPLPQLGYTESGFVNGDNASVLTGTADVTTKATEGSLPGNYVIAITQGSLTAANYSFLFKNGTLTILSAGIAATPVFSPAAGTYSAVQSVTIKDATPGAAIYYTTNGTKPTTASLKYSRPITVSASETLEALAVATNYVQSPVATAAYIMKIPVLTLSPKSVAFGDQGVDTVSTVHSVKLTNTGNGSLSIDSIGLTGASLTSFFMDDNCGTALAPGASCTVWVLFFPSARATDTAAVTIVDNAAGSPQNIPLTGTGH